MSQSSGRPAPASDETVTSRDQLVRYLESGAKPSSAWRIGTEHEKFGFEVDTLRPLAFEGERGIEAVLRGLTRFGWQPMEEGGRVVGLKMGKGSVTLEPGGQVELSGEPLDSLHDTCCEVNEHLKEVKEVADPLGVAFLGVGFQPKWRLADIPQMPKKRYRIMTRYMPTRGGHALEMMYRTATVQANLDFDSEADMIRKFRVGLALQPVATALFANSPFTEGRPNGYLSYRSSVWMDTDPDRCGDLPFVFESGMGFERYVDYALDVPMLLVVRDGVAVDAAGQSFRDFMAGRLPALPGEYPTLDDWETHLTTLFPEVRLKHFLEMRGADGGPWGRLCALPALWKGLLYDTTALDAAWDLVKEWTAEERWRLRAEVPHKALNAEIRGRSVRDIAREVLNIAEAGLRRIDRRNDSGQDERVFLADLFEVVDNGRTPAELLLDEFHNDWHGDIDPIFREHAY
ncbi:glutamate--cysteine ligase [Thiohalorhabdus methylotrophus]|uniref:Glutamate--cysteine ligase n=1 Tax=Thiohalorhabdus methylotrophus TaxID=3242694 RepID=A0ABV4TSQ4_9GAMM